MTKRYKEKRQDANSVSTGVKASQYNNIFLVFYNQILLTSTLLFISNNLINDSMTP